MIKNKKFFYILVMLIFSLFLFNFGTLFFQQNKEKIFLEEKAREIKLKEKALTENQKKLYMDGINLLNVEFNKVYLKTKRLAKDRMMNKLDLESKLLDCSLKDKKSLVSISTGLTYGNLSLNILDIFCQD